MLDGFDDLLRTKIRLAELMGACETHEDCLVLRTPSNPGYYHGNLLLLRAPPATIAPWLARFEAHFGAEVAHRALAWGGAPLSASALAEAAKHGLHSDGGVSLALDASPAIPPTPSLDWSVRPLRPGTEWSAIEALNIACDPAESLAGPSYQQFKARMRASIRDVLVRGEGVWWGGFHGARLVVQCGMVICGDLGRFQAVETHPDARRRGACSALIAHVAAHAFATHGVRRALLEADGLGPAVDLYRRLGFVPDTAYHSLIRPSEPREVRREARGESTEIGVLTRRAYANSSAADLIEALRGQSGVHSFVSVQSGAIDGHALYAPVRISGAEATWDAVELRTLAVREDRRGRGIGGDLLTRSLDALRAAGHGVCLVDAESSLFAGVGFVPAESLGRTPAGTRWWIAELKEGALAGRAGVVRR